MPKKRRPHGSGHVYRPKFKVASGEVREQKVWWIAYRAGGRLVRESADTTVKTEAETKLRGRLADIGAGLVTATSAATTLVDLRALVVRDYEVNGRKTTAAALKRRFRALEEHFGSDCRVSAIDVASVEQFKSARLQAKAKPATINRELAALRRGFRLAVKSGRLARRPDFSLLAENNARRGFFELEQFEALRAHLPEWLAPLIVFLYWTGWRGNEALGLEWRQVDRRTKTLRIEDTKNRTPRTIPYGALPQLVDVIEDQWRRTKAARDRGVIVARVFHRDGAPIRDYRVSWANACAAAGLAGRIPHDFRRTAARNMLRAGIPQPVAMLIGGWKTDSVFRRYAIVDENLIAENLAKLAPAQKA
jgi:integrase